jgi:hypothetical protein
MSEKNTALAVVAPQAPALLRPIATPAQFVAAHKEGVELIKNALEYGRDYGHIPKCGPKPALLKPGAERLALAFGCHPRYDVVEQEIDHDRTVTYQKDGRKQEALGLYRYVVRCTLVRGDGTEVGDGIASCSTMESKYVSRPRDCENTALKMASKRALVAAVLNAFGLSDRFTQDVEDTTDAEYEEAPRAAPKPAPRAEQDPAQRLTAALGWSRKHLDTLKAIADSTPAGQGEDGTEAVAGALHAAREKADATVKRLSEVDARLSVAVLALGDELECRAVGLGRDFSDDEQTAIAWFKTSAG